MRKRIAALLCAALACAGAAFAADPVLLKVDKIGLGDLSNQRIAQEVDKVLLERYNIKVQWIPIGWDENTTKPNLQMLSGDAPDIVWTDGPNANYLKWVQAGLAKAWTDEMFAAAPIAAKTMKEPFLAFNKVRGKYYLLPQLGDPLRYKPLRVIYIRADWLKKLGLKSPQTTDELLAVAKAFTEKDPDGNGKNDTYGIAGYGKSGWEAGTSNMNVFLPAFGTLGPNQFVTKDGKPVLAGLQPEFKAALAYYKKFFDSGVVDPESLNLDSSNAVQARFASGKVGIICDNGGWIDRIYGQLHQADPKAELAEIVAVKGPAGLKSTVSDLPWGAMIVSSNCKNPVAAAKFLDFTLSKDYYLLTHLGVKGVHYETDSAKPGEFIVKPYLEQRKKDKIATDAAAVMEYDLGWGVGDWGAPPLDIRPWLLKMSSNNYDLVMQERAAYDKFDLKKDANLVIDPTAGTLSESWQKFSRKFDDLTAKYFPGMIRGQMDFEKGWQDYIAVFNAMGGPDEVKKYLAAWEESK